MGFQQGLSGLDVSSKSLDAIGNNVANTSTIGFKQSKALFSDVYASTVKTSAGVGATVPKIQQEFTQGNLSTSNNPLDVGINGNGLFRLSTNGAISFARNGQFTTDKSGNIISSGGQNLTGYGVDALGNIIQGTFTNLKVSTANIAPMVTTASQVQLNLDSRSTPPTLMLPGSLTGSAGPVLATFNGAAQTINVTVDGKVATLPVTIPGPPAVYTSTGQLATAVQTAINSDLGLIGSNALVAVTVNASGFITLTSKSVGTIGSQGQGSSVAIAAGAATTALLGAAPVPLAGSDAFDPAQSTSFTVSTAQVEFDSLGNPHTLNMYFARASQNNTWQLYTTIDGIVPKTALVTGSAAPTAPGGGLDTALTFAAGDIRIDNIPNTAAIVVPAGPPHTPASLAAAVQQQINADPGLLAASRSVSVTVNGAGALIVKSNLTQGSPSVTIAASASSILMLGATTSTVTVNSATVTTQGVGTTLTGPLPVTIQFDSAGALTTTMPLNQSFGLVGGATTPLAFTLDFRGSTQYGATFGVSQLLQDGYTSGRLAGLSMSLEGIIQGRYSNGKTQNMGQVVTATFNNQNGLQPLGNNQWAETSESGQPIVGTPNSGNLGTTQSGTLEEANVDLTRELVNMITQQRSYQANAQTIKTQDQILSTLVNLR